MSSARAFASKVADDRADHDRRTTAKLDHAARSRSGSGPEHPDLELVELSVGYLWGYGGGTEHCRRRSAARLLSASNRQYCQVCGVDQAVVALGNFRAYLRHRARGIAVDGQPLVHRLRSLGDARAAWSWITRLTGRQPVAVRTRSHCAPTR